MLYRVYRGNRVDTLTVHDVRNRLELAGMKKLIIVMDRGMGGRGNIRELLDADCHVICGVSESDGAYCDSFRR